MADSLVIMVEESYFVIVYTVRFVIISFYEGIASGSVWSQFTRKHAS